jgi:hypothetical protein
MMVVNVIAMRSRRLDAGVLDQRMPLLDLGLLPGGERRGGLLLGRRDLLTESDQPRSPIRPCGRSF